MNDRKRHPAPSFASPLLTWLAIQLLAIALAAARVKLWARFPAASETLALDELLAAQFMASSLLFPFLCRDARSTIAVICASLPMIGLAGFLSFNSIASCGVSALNLSIWLAGLGVWRKVASRLSVELVAVALISSVNLGGAALAYFGAETNGAVSRSLLMVSLLAAIRLAHFPTVQGLIPAFTTLVLGACAALVMRASLSTRVMH